MYLNEVFDYLGFLGYHSRCWQLLFGGEGESRTLKQRVKNTYTLIDKGSGGGAVMRAARRSRCPPPIADSSSRVIQVFWQNCSSTIPYPAFRFSCWRAARALCKWDQLRGFDCRSERRGGRREFKGHRAGGKLDQLPEKNALGSSAAVFCSSYMKCALCLRVKILQRVCRSRLKCTQVRWQISWCAWFYFYKRHRWGLAILIHCGNRQGVLDFQLPLTSLLNLLNVVSIWNVGVLFQWNNVMGEKNWIEDSK